MESGKPWRKFLSYRKLALEVIAEILFIIR